jgi:glycosyltransferase involved in cell wall biosynthesis
MKYTESPLVSIVIPSFNHAHYLGRALQSLLNQNYTNWEAIVVDNNSMDGTDEILNSFRDPRIIVLKTHNNGVIAASRNIGIKVAKGEWIAFLDSDDWWKSYKLQTCANHFNKKTDIIYHGLEIRSSEPGINLRRAINSRQVKTPVLIDLILRGNAIANSSVVVRKELLNKIGGVSECREMISAEDFNTWLRISQLTDKFKYLPDKLGYYFIHNQGISRRDTSVPYLASVNEFLDLLNHSQKQTVESNARFISGRYYYMQKKYSIAYQKILEALPGSSYQIRCRAIIYLALIFFRQ